MDKDGDPYEEDPSLDDYIGPSLDPEQIDAEPLSEEQEAHIRDVYQRQRDADRDVLDMETGRRRLRKE